MTFHSDTISITVKINPTILYSMILLNCNKRWGHNAKNRRASQILERAFGRYELPVFWWRIPRIFLKKNDLLTFLSFLVACYATLHPAMSIRRSAGWSVGPLFTCPLFTFLAFLSLLSSLFFSSYPNAQMTSITAPAHPHATGVAVYAALFFWQSISVQRMENLLMIMLRKLLYQIDWPSDRSLIYRTIWLILSLWYLLYPKRFCYLTKNE